MNEFNESLIIIGIGCFLFVFMMSAGISEISFGGQEVGQMICDEKAINQSYDLEYEYYADIEETVVCKKVVKDTYNDTYVRIKE